MTNEEIALYDTSDTELAKALRDLLNATEGRWIASDEEVRIVKHARDALAQSTG